MPADFVGAVPVGSAEGGGTIFKLKDGTTQIVNGNSITPGPVDNPPDAGADAVPAPAQPDLGAQYTSVPAVPVDNAPHDQGAGTAFVDSALGNDDSFSAANHPLAAGLGHAVNFAGNGVVHSAEEVAGEPLAEAAAKGIVNYAPKVAAGAMRVIAPAVGLVSPESKADLEYGADKLAPPVGPSKAAAEAPNGQTTPPGNAQGAPGATAPGQGSVTTGAPASGAPGGTGAQKSPAHARQGGPDQFEQQRKKEDAAVQDLAKAESQQNDQLAKAANQNVTDRQKFDEAAAANEKTRQAELKVRQTEIDNLNDEISKTKIDPEQWWKSRSGGQKVAGAIAMFLGGMSGEEGGGLGPQMIKRAIDQNIDAQKANLANKRMGLQSKENSFARYMQMAGDARAAEAGARAEMVDLAKDKVDAIGLNTKDPIIKARAAQASAALAGEALKARHDWANVRSQMALRHAETQGVQLANQEKVQDMALKQNAIRNGLPVGAKMGQVNPVYFPGESAPRYVTGGPEAQKAALSAVTATRGTMRSIDQMKNTVASHPWQTLSSATGPGKDLEVELERTISDLYAARGKNLQPNEIIQKITEAGLSPSLYSSTADYLKRLDEYKRSTMAEANDVIRGYTGQDYFNTAPPDLQPGALKR